MEGIRTKAAQSGTAINPAARGSYDTGKSGAWKIWHGSPYAGTKGGRNKGRSYNSTYASGEYINTTSGI